MAILSIMVVNNNGHARLLKFYKEVVSGYADACGYVDVQPDRVCATRLVPRMVERFSLQRASRLCQSSDSFASTLTGAHF